jgi:hypothetical protein
MQSVYDFIVMPKGERSTSKTDIGGQELLLNTELQNHQYVNRVGVVLSTPIIGETTIEPGDQVIVHHNVFRRFYDVRGNEKNSKSFFKEGVYFVNPDQIFACKKPMQNWEPINGFYFVKPLKNNDTFSVEKEIPLKGIVKHGDKQIPEGTLVGFSPRSEYEFIIDGERLYRVPKQYITIKYEYQGNEEEYNPSWASGS